MGMQQVVIASSDHHIRMWPYRGVNKYFGRQEWPPDQSDEPAGETKSNSCRNLYFLVEDGQCEITILNIAYR